MKDPTSALPAVDGGAPAADWLTSGGEMGRLVRSMDWSKTPLGPIENWARSLKTMLGVALGSRFPMLLWWSPRRLPRQAHNLELDSGGGFGLLKALRADERTRHLPVILLSARAGEESAVEGFGAGADDYLVKPFSARELMARVRAHLELARQRRELERELEQRVQARTAEVALVSTIIGLTHAFDMTTVAEGVDNQSQLDYLVREGCDESQGYLHSRPLPRLEFESWLTGCSSAATGGSDFRRVRA
jgi:CheY-like chemotaxis protein